jgi:hypothetical protein
MRVLQSLFKWEFAEYAYKNAQPGVAVLLQSVRRNKVGSCAVGIRLLVGIVHRYSRRPQADEKALPG